MNGFMNNTKASTFTRIASLRLVEPATLKKHTPIFLSSRVVNRNHNSSAMIPYPNAAFCPPPPSLLRPQQRRPARPAHPLIGAPARRRRPFAAFPHPSLYPPQRPPDYYANVGKVIDTLRGDVPNMLSKAPDMTIYTDTLTFTDGSGYRIRGKEAYKTILWLLRAQIKLVFATSFVEVQSIYHDTCCDCVYLRWRMTAYPRWGMTTCVIDGMSVYRLDGTGWVYEHALENGARRRDRRVAFPLARVNHPVGAGAGVGGPGTGVGPGWYRSGDHEWLSVEESEDDSEVCRSL